MLENVFAVTAAGTLLLVCAGVGRALLRTAAIEPDDKVALVTWSIVAGTGLVGTLLFLVVAAAGVSVGLIAATLATLTLIVRNDVIAVPAGALAAVEDLISAHSKGKAQVTAKCALVGLSVLTLTFALPPTVDWDSLAYHLDVPSDWLREGRVHLPPDNYHTAFVGLPHTLYLPLLALKLDSGPAVFCAMILLATGFAVFAAARDSFGTHAGAIAFWLVWSSPIFLLVGTTPRVDVMLALYVLTAHHAVLASTGFNFRRAAFAAMVLGMAVGVKYHAAAWGIALLPVLFAALFRIGGRGTVLAARIIVLLVCGVLAASPWLAKNQMLIGATFYPFLAEPRVEPWLAPLHGERLAPVDVQPGVFGFHREMRSAINVWDLFVRPERLAPDADGPFSMPSFALLLVPVGTFVAWRAAVPWVAPAVIYALLMLLISPTTSLRYFIPALLPLTIIASAALAEVSRRFRDAARWIHGAVAVAVAIPSLFAIQTRVADGHPERFVVGATGRHDYLASYWETASHMDAVDWVNANLSQGDSLLMLFEARGYYYRIPHYQDLLLRNWAYINTPAGRQRCIEGLGVTHVLVNDHVAGYLRGRGARLDQVEWDSFGSFAGQCLELLHEGDGYRVYSLLNRGR